MECKSQAYWHSEYQEYQRCIKDSPANHSYKRFAKNQYHRVRRQHDKELIEEHLNASSPIHYFYEEYYDDVWYDYPSPYREHNHKQKITEVI